MKQSFFDKLTGSLKVSHPSEPQVAPSVVAQPQPQPQPQPQASALSSPVKKSPLVQPVQELKSIETETASPIAVSKEETGHNEVEGQLTIDVYQTPAEIVIKSTIAGVTMGDLDISVANDMVTIRGERKKDEEVSPEDYFHQECYWGTFSRSVILPLDVEADKANASFKNGILTIRLPKIEKVKAHKIKISSS